ncbi:MAG: ribonuclease HII, partial [Thaumarchaeota archaeon]|nr:ribonuclease HII [Nitrososphaerota archaeon]
NRDRAIEKIRKNFDVGSGYPSDSKTMNFIKKAIDLDGVPPKFVRKSWKPVKILLGMS